MAKRFRPPTSRDKKQELGAHPRKRNRLRASGPRRPQRTSEPASSEADFEGRSPAWIAEQLARGVRLYLARQYQSLGDFMIAIRCLLGLSQQEFAVKLGKTVATVAELEANGYRQVKGRSFRTILELLGGKRSVSANILRIKRNMIATRLRESRVRQAASRGDSAVASKPPRRPKQ